MPGSGDRRPLSHKELHAYASLGEVPPSETGLAHLKQFERQGEFHPMAGLQRYINPLPVLPPAR